MAADENVDLHHWQPRELLASASAQTLPEFLMRCESAFMMVVMVEPTDTELLAGLAHQATNDGDDLGPRTAIQDVARTIPSPRPRPSRAFAEETCERLPLALSRSTCYVVPICKRNRAQTVDQISLGRARDHDIVLRHPSVSKFHALLELTQDVRLLVSDCESSNHTYLNGKRVNQRVEARPGDTLKFGSVEARICTSEGFWRLVHG